MKKIFSFMMVALAAVVVVACHPKQKDDPTPTATVEEIIASDFAEMQAIDSTAIFYESHITLNQNFEDVETVDSLTVAILENIFQLADTCYIINHDLNADTNTVEKVNDYWLECVCIDPASIAVTFTDALNAYEQSNMVRVSGNTITLRQPLHPSINNPFYILGNRVDTGFVAVNVYTGEVTTLN